MGFDPVSLAVEGGLISATTAAALPSIGTVATIASLGSAAISAVGAIGQSKASSAAAGYNAKVQQQNAEIATQNAKFAGGEGEQNVGAAGAATRAKVGATLANEAGSGVEVNSGSAVDVRESEAKLGTLNALNVRAEAARSAYGYQTQSVSDTGQAALLRKQQSADQEAGYLNAGATVLGGIGKAAQYTNWLSSGGLSG